MLVDLGVGQVLAIEPSAAFEVLKENVQAHTGRVTLLRAKGDQIPPTGDLDYVFSIGVLHHIPEPIVAVRESLRVCKAGGRVFVRDLLRPESASEIDRLVGLYAAEETASARKMFAESLAAALTLEEARSLVAECGGRSDEVQKTSDRHWTWSGLR